MRSSPIAIARVFLQPKTRGRGKQTGMPSVQASVSYYEDIENRVLLEQELQSGGRPVLLPQMVVKSKEEFIVSVPDAAAGAQFIEQVKSEVTKETITLIEKIREGVEWRFYMTPLRWDDDKGFVQNGERAGEAKPPKSGFWIEPLDLPIRPNAEETFSLPPRLFRRAAGQLVCRVDNAKQAMAWITVARTDLVQIEVPADAKPKEAERGYVRQRINFDIAAWHRVLTKTGVNLCAKILGVNLVRRREFSGAKDYARTGEGYVMMVPPEKAHRVSSMFGPLLRHHHVFLITATKARRDQDRGIAVFSRLYGGQIEGLLLAEIPKDDVRPEHPIFVVVDYVAQRITQMTAEEYALFAVKHTDKALGSSF